MVALNAKYIHSSLALRSLRANCPDLGAEMLEFTINQSEDFILAEIYGREPNCVAFSCYIWNIEIIKRVINSMKKIMPETVIILGGPEATYNLSCFPECDIVVRGEGEEIFGKIVRLIDTARIEELEKIKGISYIKNGEVIHNNDSDSPDLNSLKFPYEDFEGLENKIIYYESSRGCPYMCAYCLQSAQRTAQDACLNDKRQEVQQSLRFLRLERVFKELSIFLNNKVKQVKFVDRTFNCDRERAKKIWSFLIEADNGVTNFHFEIAADLLDNELLGLIKRARRGLFQFEAGVQTTNTHSLETVGRKTDVDKLLNNARAIMSFGNIHMHLDLIVGLPYENYDSFRCSFNDVYMVKPDMLQLGFLKLLYGSALRDRASEYGIKCRESAPYEVLVTNDLSGGEIFKLKNIEKMVDVFYNTGRYKASIKYFEQFFKTPFDFYGALSEFWERKHFFELSHNRISMYGNMYAFSRDQDLDRKISADLLRYDILESGNTSDLPEWCYQETNKETKHRFYHDETKLSEYLMNRDKYQLSFIIKSTCLAFFSYDIISWLEGNSLVKKDNYIFFNYINKDIKPKVVEI